MSSPDYRIYVMELKSEPVGQVRYDRVNETEAEIDLSVASEHRGHGLGSLALDFDRAGTCMLSDGTDLSCAMVRWAMEAA